MPKRHFADWLQAYIEYASHGESPRKMHFWTGVSTIAGALRRKVWIDQCYFHWYPNFYIILVAPPGIVQKSTTVGIGMDLLRQVPGINFGPHIVTWPALVQRFANGKEGFEYNGEIHTMSSLTLESSELGNLLDPSDRNMVDLLVALWDGKQGGMEKDTKGAGNDVVENPWINLIACTTPAWLQGNFPHYLVGGGFTSRCVFVYADQKARLVAYPSQVVPRDLKAAELRLVGDLEAISKLTGEVKLLPEAYEWGTSWYERHYRTPNRTLDPALYAGYLSRKQTMMHKLAIVLAAARGDSMRITAEMLELADTMLTALEPDLEVIFSKVGAKVAASAAERLIAVIEQKGTALYSEVYRAVHAMFPSAREFEDVLSGCVKSGMVSVKQTAEGYTLCATRGIKSCVLTKET